MRIVVLDGYTLNPGDNPWDDLAALGEFTVYDRTTGAQVLERAKRAEILIINKVPLRAETISALPELKYIGILATGYDVVDLEAAGRRGIPVCNVAAYGVDAVAQHVMALLLELCRGTALHDASVKAGEWAKAPDWCYWKKPQVELSGLTMGVVGFGNNGRKVGELAHAFGMNVIAHTVPEGPPPAYAPFRFVGVDELFREADVVSLHCPLTPETKHLVNAARIKTMKRGAIVLNTARGPLVNETDAAEALHSGQLGGLGADVLSVEPPEPSNPLLGAPNTLITPHIAWATLNARKTMMRIAVDNVRGFLQGKPQSVVNAKFLG